MRRMRSRVLLAALSGWIGAAAGAWAQQTIAPTETGETGLLAIPTTQTLAPRRFSLGVYYRAEVAGGRRFENDINQLRDTSVRQAEFIAGVGLLDGLELSLQVPFVSFHNEIHKSPEESAVDEVAHNFGNLRLTPKFRLFQEGQSPMPFSLALQGAVQLPTGSKQLPAQLDRNSAFNGDKLGGEVLAVVDKDLFRLPREIPVTLSLNLGGLFPSKPDVFRLDRQTEPVFAQLRRKGFPDVGLNTAVIEYGAGLKLPLWVTRLGTLDSTAEYRGNTGTIDEADDYHAFLTGFRYTIASGWAAQGGVDFGLSNSVARYAALGGITYAVPQRQDALPHVGKERIVYRDRVIAVERVTFPDVTFEFDKAALTEAGRSRVYLISQKLKTGKNVKVEIQGRSDYIATEDHGKKLGMQRAEAVKSELVRLGVDPSRISTVSFGEDRPLADKQTPWARAVNRRAEFVVVSEPGAIGGR